MIAAEMVLVDKNKMPKTHEGLKQWVIDKSRKRLLTKYRCCQRRTRYYCWRTCTNPYKTYLAFHSFYCFSHTCDKNLKTFTTLEPHH